MQATDDSWIIASEVQFEPEPGDSTSPVFTIQVVATPQTEFLTSKVSGVDASQFEVAWAGGAADFQCLNAKKAYKCVYEYVSVVLVDLGPSGEYLQDDMTQSLLEHVRIPIFGSPPSDWRSLGNFLGGGVTTAGIATGMGGQVTPTLIFVTAGACIFITCIVGPVTNNIVVPVTRAIGRGLEYRIDKLMAPPPPPPAVAGGADADPAPTE